MQAQRGPMATAVVGWLAGSFGLLALVLGMGAVVFGHWGQALIYGAVTVVGGGVTWWALPRVLAYDPEESSEAVEDAQRAE